MVAAYLEGARGSPEQAINNAGGVVNKADVWHQLERFLILGTEGGTYYVNERELTARNIAVVEETLKEDAPRVVQQVVEISTEGRAPRNDPALLALAMATLPKLNPNDLNRRFAYDAISDVCRTGTHLLSFLAYRKALGGGWNRGLRRAVSRWFLDKPDEKLAYQMVKYKQRGGWSLRDALRLSHPKPRSPKQDVFFRWITKSTPLSGGESPLVYVHDELAKYPANPADTTVVAAMIKQVRLPREAVPTEYLKHPVVWEALLEDMPMTAMIRNLGKMTSVGLVARGSDGERRIVEQLQDVERIRKARVHPIALLVAMKVYQQGHGERGSLSWVPSKTVVTALDEAFYLAFGNVESTGKEIRLAVDTSGSMTQSVLNMPYLPCLVAAGAMALVTLVAEPRAHIMWFNTGIGELPIDRTMRLDEVVRTMQRMPNGGTDCSLPIMDAMRNRIAVDAFVTYTDGESWVHTTLEKYRQKSGLPAAHSLVSMAANHTTLADLRDPRQMDIAGFDASVPALISHFIAGTV